MHSVNNDVLVASVHENREQLELYLGAKQSMAIQRDPDSVLHEALIFRR